MYFMHRYMLRIYLKMCMHAISCFADYVQVHAGGRGKGHFDNGFKGGVHLSTDPAKIGEIAGNMLGANLITKQTPPEGQMTKKVLVHEAIDFERELYLAFLMDRSFNGPVMVASRQGGMASSRLQYPTEFPCYILIFSRDLKWFNFLSHWIFSSHTNPI